MGISWTKEQQEVIDVSGKNVLVSAAAGSGKTAVLVERIIKMITDKKHPVSLDALVVVTFTDAAAKEMKERIYSAIEKKLEEEPDNRHLQDQAVLVHNAKISTIHKFCLSVIRDNFHTIGIDPAFRVAEEGELILMQKDVITDMFEEYYEEASSGFMEYIAAFGKKRSDEEAKNIIITLYKSAMAYPDSNEFLELCEKTYRSETPEELEETDAVKSIVYDVKSKLSSQIVRLQKGLKIAGEPGGPTPYIPLFENEIKMLKELFMHNSYNELYDGLQAIDYKRLPPVKTGEGSSYDEELKNAGKKIRDDAKAAVKEIADLYFFQSPEQMLADIKGGRCQIETMVSLAREFKKRYEAKKRTANIIDFGDMEHFALEILTRKEEGHFVPSEVAKEYKKQYKEIMIDEYQDSNYLQEVIFNSISSSDIGRHNLFMVGDIKQSIYRFRLARPELFLEKYNTYISESKENTRIDLHKNFRSRSEVLDSVNFLFSHLMIKEVGGITYDKAAYLNLGADYPKAGGFDVEFNLIEELSAEDIEDAEFKEWNMANTNAEKEARYIAGRIRELVNSGVSYKDIVILMRNIKGTGERFGKILSEEGIPAQVTSRVGYFTRREVSILLDYLTIIDNGKQDIPLAAVLKSHFGKLTEEELACIKLSGKEKRFSDAFFEYAHSDEVSALKEKTEKIADTINHYREDSRYLPIHELLYNIVHETGYLRYVSSLAGGEQKRANVLMLIEKAKSFDSTSYKGVFHFIKYIEQLKKYEVEEGEAGLNNENADVVRIMTIHKSKGLEFPVVFLSQTDKNLSPKGGASPILLNASIGLGIDYIDTKNGIKGSGLIKNAISAKEHRDSLGEELRILYVAMTRAKEKLIITGTAKSPEETVKSYQYYAVPYHLFGKVKNYEEIILPVIVGFKTENKIKLNIISCYSIYMDEAFAEAKDYTSAEELSKLDECQTYDNKMKEAIQTQFADIQTKEKEAGLKMKISVTELKRLAYQEETNDALELYTPEVQKIIPKFIKGEEVITGAGRGTAYHRALELIDFTSDYNEVSEIRAAIDGFVKEGSIAAELGDIVNAKDIYEFLQSKTGVQMQEAARRGMLFKEQPFVLGLPACDVYMDSSGEELILVQGIIDVYYEHDNKLVILDYKTDKVREGSALKEKYSAQLEYYSKALEQITGKEVADKIIYSFTLGEEIEL